MYFRTFLLAAGLLSLSACTLDFKPTRPEPITPPEEAPLPPEDGWGELVKVKDLLGDQQKKTPHLERGALVHAKVVVGFVEAFSSDTSVFEVLSVETIDVTSPTCETCRLDYDTNLTLIGRAVGSAELIVRGPTGDERRLPVEVSESEAVFVRQHDEEVDEITVQPDHLSGVRLVVVDGEENHLATHITWEIADTDIAEFEFIDWPLTWDLFAISTPSRHEGPGPIIKGNSTGETTLRITTTGGLELTVPLRVEL